MPQRVSCIASGGVCAPLPAHSRPLARRRTRGRAMAQLEMLRSAIEKGEAEITQALLEGNMAPLQEAKLKQRVAKLKLRLVRVDQRRARGKPLTAPGTELVRPSHLQDVHVTAACVALPLAFGFRSWTCRAAPTQRPKPRPAWSWPPQTMTWRAWSWPRCEGQPPAAHAQPLQGRGARTRHYVHHQSPPRPACLRGTCACAPSGQPAAGGAARGQRCGAGGPHRAAAGARQGGHGAQAAPRRYRRERKAKGRQGSPEACYQQNACSQDPVTECLRRSLPLGSLRSRVVRHLQRR